MRAVFIRIRSRPDRHAAAPARAASESGRTGSSSKNMMDGLLATGFLTAVEEWELGGRDTPGAAAGRRPVYSFPNDDRLGDVLAHHADLGHAPDILWVEGMTFPVCLQRVFQTFPNTFKLVYSKHWKPWEGEGLDAFDLVLLDDHHQIARLHEQYPRVACGVWDKLLDYEGVHRPLGCDKRYDVCYVAYLRPRKNHGLLFRSLAALGRSELKCVCVGADREGYQAELERLARSLRLNVTFTGDVNAAAVNRFINESRIGVMCSERDAAPRAILEYMAADVPVLVNSQLLAGARYVGPRAGLVRAPDQFATSIAELLAQRHDYSPRDELLTRFSGDRVVPRFRALLEHAGCGAASHKECNTP